MKTLFYRLILTSQICLGLLPLTLKAQISQKAIFIQFEEQAHEAFIRNPVSSTRESILTTAFEEMNRLNEENSAVSIRPLFRTSERFKARHRRYGLDRWYILSFKEEESSNPKLLASTYNQLSEISVAEQIPIIPQGFDPSRESQGQVFSANEDMPPGTLSTFDSIPNDPLFPKQWSLHNTGQSGGTPGADINILDAWNIQKGSPEVIVAVTELRGVDPTHPDLRNNMWVNTLEAEGIPGVDDDQNGFIDDVHGYNFGLDTGYVSPGDHATFVAGVIAAETDNGIGISGIAGGTGLGDGVKIMSCNISPYLPEDFVNSVNYSNPEAFVYSADNGAVISNNSWGGFSLLRYSAAFRAAIRYFVDNAGKGPNGELTGPMSGGILIASAMNENLERVNVIGSLPGAISVAATNHRDEKAIYSNFGKEIALSAPGGETNITNEGEVWAPILNGEYRSWTGTSFAAPQVSGVAALIASQYPGIRAEEVWARLLGSTDPIENENPQYPNKLGTGRLNAYKALLPIDGISPASIGDLSLTDSTATGLQLSWTAPAKNGTQKVALYDLRYSTTPINAGTFESASRVWEAPIPLEPGEIQQVWVEGLQSDTDYFFAIQALDQFANRSALSNLVSATTRGAPRLSVDQSQFSWITDLEESDQFSTSLTISNTGKAPMEFIAEGIFEGPFTDSIFYDSMEIETYKYSGFFFERRAFQFTSNLFSKENSTFNLSHIRNNFRTEFLKQVPVKMEIFDIRQSRLDEKVFKRSSTFGKSFILPLNDPISIPAGESFNIRFSYPEGIKFFQGFDTDVSSGSDEKGPIKIRALSTEAKLRVTPSAGVLLPGQSVDLAFSFEANGQANGSYNGHILLGTNDPVKSDTEIPISYEVINGLPELSFSLDTLKFVDALIATEQIFSVVLSNSGQAELIIAEISGLGESLKLKDKSLPILIPTKQRDTLFFSFQAEAQQIIDQPISFVTNTQEGNEEIWVRAQASARPILDTESEKLVRFVEGTEKVSQEWKIFNKGISPLEYSSLLVPGSRERIFNNHPNPAEITDAPSISAALSYDLDTEADGFLACECTGAPGYSTIFHVPDSSEGFLLTHIQNYYRTEGLADPQIQIEVFQLSSLPGGGMIEELVLKQRLFSPETESGALFHIELAQPYWFASGTSFRIRLFYPAGMVAPQGYNVVEGEFPGTFFIHGNGQREGEPNQALKIRALQSQYNPDSSQVSWLSLSPSHTGLVEPGNAKALNFEFDPTQFPQDFSNFLGNQHARLILRTNDPLQAYQEIPILAHTAVNHPPELSNPIPDKTYILNEPVRNEAINFFSHFSDQDFDIKEVDISFFEEGIVEATTNSSSTASFRPLKKGETDVIYRVIDQRGASASDTFRIKVVGVVSPPVPTFQGYNPRFNPQRLRVNRDTFELDLNNYYFPPNSPFDITYEFEAEPADMLDYNLSNGILQISAIRKGFAQGTITASVEPKADNLKNFRLSNEASISIIGIEDGNQSPIVTKGLDFYTHYAENEPITIPLLEYFSDPDGDSLEFTYLLPPGSEALDIDIQNNIATIIPLEAGENAFRIYADDKKGGLIYDQSLVYTDVNRAPIVTNPIKDQLLLLGNSVNLYDLLESFTDPDGDELEFSVASTFPFVAEATREGINTLGIKPRNPGVTQVLVTAFDKKLGDATFFFEVEVADIVSSVSPSIRQSKPYLFYPNPASNELNLYFKEYPASTFDLVVFDMKGKSLLEYNQQRISRGKAFTFSVEDLSPGLYFARVSSPMGVHTTKFLIK